MRNTKHRFSSPRHPRRRSEAPKGSAPVLLYGIHAVEAALANPKREIRKLHLTENAARRLEPLLLQRRLKVEPALPKTLDRLLGGDAVHQGAVIEVEDLPTLGLDDIITDGLLVVL